ncbi:hypothetical protein FRC12_020321 [Ceratobasidium sp. 428]|nr:hypothetical protein FRC12_020321 [Ceratobasidium sp. 428]
MTTPPGSTYEPLTLEQAQINHGQAACPDPNTRAALQTLAAGADLPPWELRDDVTTPKHKEVTQILRAAAREISRQYNVNIFACGVWADDLNTVYTARLGVFADEKEDCDYTFDYVVRQWIDYVARHCGTRIALAALRALPTIFPDWEYFGRPCPPPAHPDWVVEKAMWIEYFIKLYRYQGGYGKPNWDEIKRDLDNGGETFIERKRLAGEHVPFVKPKDWNEVQTREYGAALRSTLGRTGRVLPERKDTTFQFRRVTVGPDGDRHSTDEKFRETIHDESDLVWETPALLYGRRVARAEQQSQEGPVQDVLGDRPSVDNMFPAEAEKLMERVNGLVRFNTFKVLWEKLMAHEKRAKFMAPPPSEAVTNAWPTPARLIARSALEWKSNFMVYRYPPEFGDWSHDNSDQWEILGIMRWIKRKSFVDASTSLASSGFHGIIVQFVTLLQYAINMHLVISGSTEGNDEREVEREVGREAEGKGKGKSRAEEEEEEDKGEYKRTFGEQEWKMVRYSAREIIDQVDASAEVDVEPPIVPSLETDELAPAAAWNPTAWLQVSENDEIERGPSDALIERPSSNVFERKLADFIDKRASSSQAARERGSKRGEESASLPEHTSRETAEEEDNEPVTPTAPENTPPLIPSQTLPRPAPGPTEDVEMTAPDSSQSQVSQLSQRLMGIAEGRESSSAQAQQAAKDILVPTAVQEKQPITTAEDGQAKSLLLRTVPLPSTNQKVRRHSSGAVEPATSTRRSPASTISSEHNSLGLSKLGAGQHSTPRHPGPSTATKSKLLEFECVQITIPPKKSLNSRSKSRSASRQAPTPPIVDPPPTAALLADPARPNTPVVTSARPAAPIVNPPQHITPVINPPRPAIPVANPREHAAPAILAPQPPEIPVQSVASAGSAQDIVRARVLALAQTRKAQGTANMGATPANRASSASRTTPAAKPHSARSKVVSPTAHRPKRRKVEADEEAPAKSSSKGKKAGGRGN